uniref:Uncharacterized protein n=1 Tax=Anopheles darlingi TaxID=43151 RepID=A0A2M4DS74_ANODA
MRMMMVTRVVPIVSATCESMFRPITVITLKAPFWMTASLETHTVAAATTVALQPRLPLVRLDQAPRRRLLRRPRQHRAVCRRRLRYPRQRLTVRSVRTARRSSRTAVINRRRPYHRSMLTPAYRHYRMGPLMMAMK